jgi:DNA-binding CsgD family transcriptional regulator
MPANSNKKWTPEVDKQLLDLRAAGKSTFAIAAELRRSITSVRGRLSVLKAKGRLASSSDAIHSTPRRKRWTLDDDQRLMDLRAKGASFNEIAIALGRTEAARTTSPQLETPSCVALYLDAGLTPSRFEP